MGHRRRRVGRQPTQTTPGSICVYTYPPTHIHSLLLFSLKVGMLVADWVLREEDPETVLNVQKVCEEVPLWSIPVDGKGRKWIGQGKKTNWVQAHQHLTPFIRSSRAEWPDRAVLHWSGLSIPTSTSYEMWARLGRQWRWLRCLSAAEANPKGAERLRTEGLSQTILSATTSRFP